MSARKEARSAHVEISKMDVQDEGRKERTAPKPQSRHEAPACLCLFLRKHKHVPGLFRLFNSLVFSKSSWSLSFLGRLLSLTSELDFLVCWFCMTPAGLTRKECKFVVSAERACWTVPQAVLYECPGEPRLTFFLVAVVADLVARCQVSVN